MSIALAPVVVAVPAHAQLFDQFVPAEVYGADIEPDVTVATRVKPGYDNGGVQVGNVVIRPRVSQSAGYESNVLGQSKARGSSLIDTNAAVEVRAENSRSTIIGAAAVDDTHYLDLPNQSYTNWSTRINGSYNIGRDVATLLVSHENQVQSQRDLDVPQLSVPLPIAIDRLRAGYIANFNRLSLTPQIEVARFAYQSAAAGGVIYDQSYRNRITVSPEMIAAYEFATRRKAVLIVQDSVGLYSRGSVALPRRNFNDVAVLGGLDYDLNGSLRTRLLVGYERRTFSSTAYPTIQAPVAELTLIYNLTGLTTITGTLARRIQDSASDTVAGATSLIGSLRVDHELRRNVLLAATGGVTRNEYAAAGGTQTLFTGNLSATYLLNRVTAATATYDVLARTGTSSGLNFGGLSTGSDYVDHRLMLQLRLAL